MYTSDMDLVPGTMHLKASSLETRTARASRNSQAVRELAYVSNISLLDAEKTLLQMPITAASSLGRN